MKMLIIQVHGYAIDRFRWKTEPWLEVHITLTKRLKEIERSTVYDFMVRLRHRTQLLDRCFKAHLLWLQISFLDILKLQIHDWSSSWAQNFHSFLL